ncbi:MerC domain-containing protein [Flagellimonas allohymeniacidonis]|uniref:MerC domain-containing protein n=1 Tax=Flagellimonas allohymeniacidonis TaxID=2517819 RepID=A0A4Q8QHK0_9FLAO|nr:MerC domain-containing protein [Allomuricauda hymeniacidonis]TAI49257.1 MerC domain-containing protein [Allomuricauda hymeniacidonis]
MKIINISSRSDLIGALASSFCLIHCVATPLLFTFPIVNSANNNHGHNLWWGILDLVFLGISLLAVNKSATHTTKSWVGYALWGTWGSLALIILNEKISLIPIWEEAIYLPAIALVFLHIYNRKYCRCGNEKCCAVK